MTKTRNYYIYYMDEAKRGFEWSIVKIKTTSQKRAYDILKAFRDFKKSNTIITKVLLMPLDYNLIDFTFTEVITDKERYLK